MGRATEKERARKCKREGWERREGRSSSKRGGGEWGDHASERVVFRRNKRRRRRNRGLTRNAAHTGNKREEGRKVREREGRKKSYR